MPTIKDIEGIGGARAVKLRAAGVRTTDALLKMGRKPEGRKEMAAKTGFSQQTILEWVNRADMFRVHGIGSQYSDLLEAAGVDTVRELALRNAEALLAALTKINAKKNMVNKLPSLSLVKSWIKNAKALPRGVDY